MPVNNGGQQGDAVSRFEMSVKCAAELSFEQTLEHALMQQRHILCGPAFRVVSEMAGKGCAPLEAAERRRVAAVDSGRCPTDW